MANSEGETKKTTAVPFQPGEVITPNGTQPTADQPAATNTPPAQEAASPAAVSPRTAPIPDPVIPDVPAAAGPAEQPSLVSTEDESGITWTASEFVAHEKSASWFISLGVGAMALALIIFFLTKDYVTAGVILFGAFLLGIFGARQPRQLEYRLDSGGLSIGAKRFGYEEFRSFAIAEDGAFSSIVLMPLKRFAPLITIYYAPDDEENIVTMLADRLPLEEHKPDAVDSLMRRMRF